MEIKTDYILFLGVIYFRFASLYFELRVLIIRNKTSSPKDFELMSFDCTLLLIIAVSLSLYQITVTIKTKASNLIIADL